MVNIEMPSTSGNQPPSNILSSAAEKKVASIRKKKPVAKMHSHSG